MSLKTRFFMGTMFSIILIFSCSKDKISTPNSQPNPPSNTNSIAEIFPDLVHENTISPIISEKEVNEIIQAKELMRALIKESLIQLLFNSHFNPDMPQINTRLSCVTCPQTDCGCPYQDESLDPDISVYPQLLSLKYYDPDGCTCTLATSPTGLEVTGELQIKFSDPFTTPGHVLTLYPQEDFTVDGYDIDADVIELTDIEFMFGNSDSIRYNITKFENVSVTKNGDVTLMNLIGDNSKLTIIDTGSNHGSINNAYGLLDDIFQLRLRLAITCSNGETVSGISTEDLIYDMSCSSIQDGTMILLDQSGGLVSTYDYGAPAIGLNPGICDDSILVIIPTTGD